MLDWPVSVVFDNFWSPELCGVTRKCALWNWDQGKFIRDIDSDIVNIYVGNRSRMLYCAD